VPPLASDGQLQTVGTALNSRMPDLFPSRRTCVLARPLIHGVVAPMQAPLAHLLNVAMYLDGFLHISILMMA
jgi:autophagy-related protein 5